MKLSAKSGATIAAAAAALMLAGTVTAPTAVAQDNVKCYGVNACKGQAACKTAKNDCKGHNACKGQGFVQLSKADCEAKGGSTSAPKS
jgi:hypothetical protein